VAKQLSAKLREVLGESLEEGVSSPLFEVQFRMFDFSEVSWSAKSTRVGEFLLSSEGGWLSSGEVFGFFEFAKAGTRKRLVKLNLMGSRSDWQLERLE
jgi:hypothetical protein